MLTQLAEIAFNFNISQDILDEIGAIQGQKVAYQGKGLGKRPMPVPAGSEGNGPKGKSEESLAEGTENIDSDESDSES